MNKKIHIVNLLIKNLKISALKYYFIFLKIKNKVINRVINFVDIFKLTKIRLLIT